ncbi:MAG: HEAT repeat domain-containing protein [Candidatus Muirbacterium halophilum]|nr:HEAT repeat domain-containing protein [Candidatus Muirbacterium halophilum]MCK9475374.1 HEAT repeat domain-containing protein [Candidatus Muirbacterium halophilum]
MVNYNTIIELLKTENDDSLNKAKETLESVGYSSVFFKTIKNNFKDFSQSGKLLIFNTIKSWKTGETANFIIELYKESNDFHEKMKLIIILDSIPLKTCLTTLIDIIHNEKSYELKIHFLNILGNSKLIETYETIIAFLSSDDIELRAAALKNAINVDYRKTFTIMINIFDSKNSKKINDILSILTFINSKELRFEISDFLVVQAAKFKKEPDLFIKFVKTLFNFNNFKVLKIVKDMIKRNLMINKIKLIITDLKKYDYSEEIENFYFFLLTEPQKDLLNIYPEIILSHISKKEIAIKYLEFINSDEPLIRNIVTKLIISFSLLNRELDSILIENLKKEINPDYFADCFISLCITKTNNNDKIVNLNNYFKRLPENLKLKIIINFRKLPANKFASDILYFIYTNEKDSEKVRATIASILGITGTEDCISIFKELLKDENSRVRANAVESIEMTIKNSDIVINAVFPLLQDFNNRVKANVAITLWHHGGLRMLALLHKMLETHEDKWHRASAAYALSIIKNNSSITTLLGILKKDEDSAVKMNCIRALGEIGDHGTLDTIISFFELSDDRIKEKVIEACGNFLNNDKAVEFLFSNLKQSQWKNLIKDTLKKSKKINNKILKRYFLIALNKKTDIEIIFEITACVAGYSFVDFLKEQRTIHHEFETFFNNTIDKIKHRIQEEK